MTKERLHSLLPFALAEAIMAHRGQVDKQGQTYILHILRVVLAVSDEAKVVAALHDVLEDSNRNLPFFWNELTDEERVALRLLTRGPEQPYGEYIHAIATSGNHLAAEVKVADLVDNLRPGGPSSLRERYDRALRELTTEKRYAMLTLPGQGSPDFYRAWGGEFGEP